MKKLLYLFFALAFVISGCNKIPNKSIFIKLSTKELADAIKSDTSFGSFYELTESYTKTMSDVAKANYKYITYRQFFKYVTFLNNTAYWKPLRDEWEKEWNSEFGMYEQKIDSTINYWKKYKEDHSLDKYVKIELDKIKTTYFIESNEISGTLFGFKFTPLKGTVDQIEFNYEYSIKTEENAAPNKEYCIFKESFSSPVVKYFYVNTNFDNQYLIARYNAKSFLKDYSIHTEITEIIKDGITINDIGIPEIVKTCINDEIKYGYITYARKDDLIKELMNKNYMPESKYYLDKKNAILEEKDKSCFNFVRYANYQAQKGK